MSLSTPCPCALSHTVFLLLFHIMNPYYFAMGLSKDYSNITQRREKMYIMNENCESTKLLFLSATFTKEYFMAQTLLEMAKDLVMAQIEVYRLSPEEMHTALQQTYTTLQALQVQEDAGGSVAVATPETSPEPVNWKKSITKHAVTCLECGQALKQISVRQLKEHGLDGRSYRIKYGIPRTQPLAAKETTSRRKEIVQKSRPWEKAPTFITLQRHFL
jgi:predicted transcriptional regulator